MKVVLEQGRREHAVGLIMMPVRMPIGFDDLKRGFVASIATLS